MTRPETALDVVELVRRARLAAEPELARVAARLSAGVSPAAALGLLIADGLLTPFQAEEVLAGRWRGLWLGGYRVLDRLGKGGMGHVVLAEHGVLKKRVAVKVLSAALRSDPTARRRFVREARAAAVVDHPNVVHVHDVDIEHDPPYLVMEYVDGISLQAAVARHGTFAGGEVAAIGAEVARGLAAAHAAGLVHRDIKPANLLVDRRGGLKILDLGIVRFPGDDTQPRALGADEILGTLDYLAPEQAEDSAGVDARADLYALGATLYFLLAGHPPFPGTDIRHKLVAKQYSDPPPVHRLRPDVDPDLSAVVQALLTRDPAARTQTAIAVVTALVPFAATPADFPARLFRPERPSTATDHAPVQSGGSGALPATQVIRKSAVRPAAPAGPAEADIAGPPTARGSRAPTDLVMTPLPPDPPPRPVVARRPEVVPPHHGYLRVFGWVLLGVLGTTGGVYALIRVLTG